MKLGIVARRGDPRAADLAADLHATLSADGIEVVLDEAAAAAAGADPVSVGEMADCPLVVSVGGDGTFLHAARSVGSTPILGVNLGEVGFLNAVAPDEASDRVHEEVARIRETGGPRFREATRVEARGDGWSLPPALNEVVVAGPGRGHGRGLDVEVRIDGSRYADGHADGVLVATQTGSTAYNLSEGGPLVHPSADGLVVTGMCAAEAMPPLVVGPGREISIRAAGVERVVVAADAHERRWIEAPAAVTVGAAAEPARIAGPPSDFFRALGKLRRSSFDTSA